LVREKTHAGTPTLRRWDTAQPPLDRLLMPEVVTEAQRSQLAHLRIQINPRVLRQTIYCDLEQMP
jgi:hypothetical protein